MIIMRGMDITLVKAVHVFCSWKYFQRAEFVFVVSSGKCSCLLSVCSNRWGRVCASFMFQTAGGNFSDTVRCNKNTLVNLESGDRPTPRCWSFRTRLPQV
ncbi:hypothetical protein AMECASPLE_023819 [Ameca splendens]|uniref:Secreted protein n=1 Tax=Ameca splendens TaxID=208324 RepID=A0ABV1ABX9_9TELE